MIAISDKAVLDESELEIKFIRASGPGGQNVNKVATAVQLRFDVSQTESLPEDVKTRLTRLAGKRMSDKGVILIDARRYRSQSRNRDDAIKRLADLIERAFMVPKPRRKRKPSQAVKEKRLREKRRKSGLKQKRRPVKDEDI